MISIKYITQYLEHTYDPLAVTNYFMNVFHHMIEKCLMYYKIQYVSTEWCENQKY